MMAEGPDYIVILSEGHKSMFPHATCRPLTRKIFIAKNGINIYMSGEICYLMCTGPLLCSLHMMLFYHRKVILDIFELKKWMYIDIFLNLSC